ncbi:granulocyte-macrophage colony-stimulating factor receptor subunit alpha-like [Nycticebus coucang]|uniref:granulocyte-macrophage colony-stimulating factor receptor subunit alpha-like n=1 Tax=Nycticebus coucang TaxID=9470 RepID=UPI00234C517E|nr:granulocyte-macrophage colony-stimulating factor receptor subunit alpha-like [Nycticebus coucang]
MLALLDSAWLLVLLTPACCQEGPHLAKRNISPIINLKLDQRKKMLTWNYIRNVSHSNCSITTPLNPDTRTSPQVGDDNTYFCIFPNSVLHRGANLTVSVTSDGSVFKESLAIENSGEEGTGAMNFSCLIYNVHFMNCTWAPGPAAPADTQYQLYSWESTHDDEKECSHYITDSMRTHVGCHYDQLGEAKITDNYFFLVNGTSNHTMIPFLDFTPFVGFKMEKYNPPANITISYNGSNHVIQWDNPEIRFDLGSQIFYYELDMQRKGGSPKKDPVSITLFLYDILHLSHESPQCSAPTK